MAEIFSTQFQLGSYVSRQGDVLVNTNGSFSKREKGLAWEGNGSSSNIFLGNNIFTSAELVNGSVEVWGKIKAFPSAGALNEFVSFEGFIRIDVVNNGGIITFRAYAYDGGAIEVISTTNPKLNQWYHILLTWDGAIYKLYIDNTQEGGNVAGGSPVFDLLSRANYIGASYTNSTWLNGYVGKITVNDHILSEKERSQSYKKFLNAVPLISEKAPKYGPWNKPHDLSHVDGLVFASNMIPSSGGVLTDISGNGNNGTINGTLQTSEGIAFNGISDYINIPEKTISKTAGTFVLIFMVKDLSAHVFLLTNKNTTKDYLQVRTTGALQGETSTNAELYISGGSVLINQVYNLICSFDNNEVKSYLNGVLVDTKAITNNLKIEQLGAATDASNFTECEFYDFQIYSYAFTQAQAEAYHNSFVKPVLIDKFEYDAVGNVPLHWKNNGTGTYNLAEESSRDDILTHIKSGYKFLENSVAGTIAIQSKQAYGTFCFDWYKDADANQMFINFISNKIGEWSAIEGYGFLVDNDESIHLEAYDGVGGTTAVMSTAASYIAINTWYRVKIERTLSGVFTTYIKGGTLGDVYVLMSVTGGANPSVANNTYKTSEYFVPSVDAIICLNTLINY